MLKLSLKKKKKGNILLWSTSFPLVHLSNSVHFILLQFIRSIQSNFVYFSPFQSTYVYSVYLSPPWSIFST